jgi:hypothetical protein
MKWDGNANGIRTKTRNKKRWKETNAYQSWGNGAIRNWINERTRMSQKTTLN